MKTLPEIKQILREQKPFLYQQYGVVDVGVFGSYVRDEQQPESDIDVLIELKRPPQISLLDLINLQNYLSDLLEMQVDVALKTNLRKRIGKRILAEVEPV